MHFVALFYPVWFLELTVYCKSNSYSVLRCLLLTNESWPSKKSWTNWKISWVLLDDRWTCSSGPVTLTTAGLMSLNDDRVVYHNLKCQHFLKMVRYIRKNAKNLRLWLQLSNIVLPSRWNIYSNSDGWNGLVGSKYEGNRASSSKSFLCVTYWL